jgi:hypothetical protein
MCKTRGRLPHEIHETVFGWVLQLVAEQGLVKAKRLGIGASTMEAIAALRTIMRRQDGRTYREMLTQMARRAGSRRRVFEWVEEGETGYREFLMPLLSSMPTVRWNSLTKMTTPMLTARFGNCLVVRRRSREMKPSRLDQRGLRLQ